MRHLLLLLLLCTSAAAAPVARQTETLSLNPSLYWRMTNTSGTTITDIAVSPHNGTASGSFTLNQTSLLNADANPAILMTGGAVTSSAFFSASSGVTINFLFKPTLVTTNVVTIGSPSTGVGGMLVRYIASSNAWRITYANSGVNIDLEASAGLVAGQVYELTATLDFTTGTAKFYQNGRLVGTQTGARVPVAISSKAVVLGDGTTNATVDELSIYTSVLTATDALNLFKSSRAIDPATTAFYADDAGVVNTDCSLSTPADLQWLLASGLSQPNSSIELRAGTYAPTVKYTVYLGGSAGNPVTLKAYNKERAQLDGVNLLASTGGLLTVNSAVSYLVVQDLEITNSSSVLRVSAQSGSNPTDIGPIVEGVQNLGDHNSFINNVIYDIRGNGIADESTSTNTTLYGNLIFNIGWQGPDRGHGHCIYTQNSTPSVKLDQLNVMFNGFGYGIHAFSTAGTVDNFTFDDNVSFQGGAASRAYGLTGSGASPTYFIGAGQAANNILYTDNLSYDNFAGGTFVLGGTTTSVYNGDLTMSGANVSVGGTSALTLSNWATVTISGLKLYGSSVSSGQDGVLNTGSRNGVAPTTANWSWNNNTYYNLSTLSGGLRFGYTVGGTGGGGFKTYAQYKAITSFDAGSTETIGAMPDATYIKPNAYDIGKCVIAVYNLSAATTKSVNLSTCGLVDGQEFAIQNAQDYFGTAALTGTYNASSPSVTLPVNSSALQVPDGFTPYSASMASTAPTFFVGILIPGDANPSAPDAPTGLASAWSFSTQGGIGNVALTWVNPTSGAAVIVDKSADGVTWTNVTTTAADATGYTVTGLADSGLWLFRVRSSKTGLESINVGPVSEYATRVRSYKIPVTR